MFGATALAALLLAVVAGCASDLAASGAGPLQLPQHYGFMAAPMRTGSFHSFDVCAARQPIRLRVVDVRAGRLVGTSRVRFAVAWPRPGQVLASAGRLPLEPGYRPAAGAAGRIRACADMSGPGMAVVVVLPPARERTVVVHDVEITYRVGERQYTTVARVRLGTCASDPLSPSAQPRECRKPAGA